MNKTQTTMKNWARSADARIRFTRFNQDHTLEADAQGRSPQLRIWIPLARRTPLFVFGPDASQPAEVDVEATFPSFDNENELISALDKVRSDFLAHYSARPSSSRSRNNMTHCLLA